MLKSNSKSLYTQYKKKQQKQEKKKQINHHFKALSLSQQNFISFTLFLNEKLLKMY